MYVKCLEPDAVGNSTDGNDRSNTTIMTTATAVTTSHSSLVMMMSQTDPPNIGFLP